MRAAARIQSNRRDIERGAWLLARLRRQPHHTANDNDRQDDRLPDPGHLPPVGIVAPAGIWIRPLPSAKLKRAPHGDAAGPHARELLVAAGVTFRSYDVRYPVFVMICPRLRPRLIAAATVIGVASIAVSAEAQTQSADERAIRDLIARYDKGESVLLTDDTIYWTGPFQRPTVGSQKPEPLPRDQQPSSARPPGVPSERVPGSRRRVTTPVRIEIATSGDLAYEFSHSEVVFDLKNGERESASPASVLRVWKKDGAQWKIAAMFARPHYQEDAAPPNAN